MSARRALRPLRVALPFVGVLLCVGGLGVLGCSGETSAFADADVPTAITDEGIRAPLRVRAALVTESRVGGLADVTGMTSAFRTATVASEVTARVLARSVEAGAQVAAGDALIRLDDTLLAIAVDEASATLRSRAVDVAEARRELERSEELRRKDAISEHQHDEIGFQVERAESHHALAEAALRRARRAVRDAVVRAPFDGTVERVHVQMGDHVVTGAPVVTLADFSQVRLHAGATAAEAADLSPGLAVRVAIPALGGLTRDATIHSVGRMADEANGTYPIEVWLHNDDGRLRAGMVGQLQLAATAGGTGVTVPRAALLRRDGHLTVFVVVGAEDSLTASARRVRVGRQSGDSVEILEGTQPGERVVTDGLFALTDGAQIYVDGLERSEVGWND